VRTGVPCHTRTIERSTGETAPCRNGGERVEGTVGLSPQGDTRQWWKVLDE
jgi:hypothetical protein